MDGLRTCRYQGREHKGSPNLRSLPYPPTTPVQYPALAERPTGFATIDFAPDGSVVWISVGIAAPTDLKVLALVSSERTLECAWSMHLANFAGDVAGGRLATV